MVIHPGFSGIHKDKFKKGGLDVKEKEIPLDLFIKIKNNATETLGRPLTEDEEAVIGLSLLHSRSMYYEGLADGIERVAGRIEEVLKR